MFQSTEPKRTRSTFTNQDTYPNKLIRKGTTMDTSNASRSMLSLVVEYDQHQLVYSRPVKDINAHDNQGNTVLHYVAENRSTKTLNALLEEYGDRMDMNALNHRGETPLDRVMDSKPRRAKSALIRLLKKHKALSNRQGSLKRIKKLNKRFLRVPLGGFASCVDAAFQHACRHGSIDDIAAYVNAGIVNVDDIDMYHKTPLMNAMQNQHADAAVDYLIRHDANVNEKNKYNENILHHVSDHFFIKPLLQYIAPKELNRLSKYQETPLDATYRHAADAQDDAYTININQMKKYGCKSYSHDDQGIMCTKGYGTLNTEMIQLCKDQKFNVFLHIFRDKDRYSKGIALLEAAKSKNYELTRDLFRAGVYKKSLDIHGNTFLHYIARWEIFGKLRPMIASEIIHNTPTYIFYIKNKNNETANERLKKNIGLNQMRLNMLQSRNTTCKKYENIKYQLLSPSSIQNDTLYHWDNAEEQLSVQIQYGYTWTNYRNLSYTWCAILKSYYKTNDVSRIFKHDQQTSCIPGQEIVCCYNEAEEQLEIVYVYTSACKNKHDYNQCSCILGICTKAVGYTLYALKDYILRNQIGNITSGKVYIYSYNPCNAFNCYNRAFILNGFRMHKPYESYEQFLKELKKWQKQNIKTEEFNFTMYYDSISYNIAPLKLKF